MAPVFVFLKRNLFKEWFIPLNSKISQFFTGLIFAFIAFLIPLAIKTVLFSIEWSMSENFEITTIVDAFNYFSKSVLFEELVFRGALLSLLIVYLRESYSVLISAIIFGVYHWFSYGMFGSGLIPMLYIFIVTGAMGWVWAHIYAKTNSIVMPTAIHLGWNFFSSLVLDYNPFGELLLRSSNNSQFSEIVNFLIQFGSELLAVLLIFGLFNLYNKKRPILLNQPIAN